MVKTNNSINIKLCCDHFIAHTNKKLKQEAGSQTLSSFLSLKVKYFARNEDQLALKVILQLGMRAEPQCYLWINK